VACEPPPRAGVPPLGEGLWKGEEYSNVRRGEICGSFYLQGRVDVEDVDPDDKKKKWVMMKSKRKLRSVLA
jgi:hypothetical protein